MKEYIVQIEFRNGTMDSLIFSEEEFEKAKLISELLCNTYSIKETQLLETVIYEKPSLKDLIKENK